MKKIIDYFNNMIINDWININIRTTLRIILFNFSIWILYNGCYTIIYNPSSSNFFDSVASVITITMMMLFIQCVIFYPVLIVMLYKRFSKNSIFY